MNGKPIPVAVFVLTDGETGDISNIVTAVSQAVAKAEAENGLLRVFVLGIADDVSTRVCEKIARAGKGIAVYVGVSGPLVQSVDLSYNWCSESWHSPSRAIVVGR